MKKIKKTMIEKYISLLDKMEMIWIFLNLDNYKLFQIHNVILDYVNNFILIKTNLY